MSKEKDLGSGKILLSEPFMQDPNFKRAVVLICEYSADSTVGFVLNKPLKMNIDELISDFPEFESEVYFGGPVATDTIHYVHNVGDLLEESVEVGRGVFWGGNFEKLKFLIQSELITGKDIKFFVGYSGWSPMQLDEEMEYGSWVLADMDPNYVFKSNPKKLWQQIMENKGNNYSVIAQMPDNANWN
ncbi:MAG: YqgE/AlgH family protein [Bacteroidota bacterium]